MKKMKLMVRNYKKKIEFVSEILKHEWPARWVWQRIGILLSNVCLSLVGMEVETNILSLMLEMRWWCSVHVVNMLMYPSMYNIWCKLRVSVFITLLGADFMRMESFGKVEEVAETLVEDNGEEHEEHGTQEEEAVDVDVDSTDGAIVTILFDNGYSHGVHW
ncbi:hypothetical protein C5167_010645, partial [Papaver somniferum]